MSDGLRMVNAAAAGINIAAGGWAVQIGGPWGWINIGVGLMLALFAIRPEGDRP